MEVDYGGCASNGNGACELPCRLRSLVGERRCFGCRWLWLLLRRKGDDVNNMLVYMAHRQEGLSVRQRERKQAAGVAHISVADPERPIQRGPMDFVADGLGDGRRVSVLTVVDDLTRECLATEVDTALCPRNGAGPRPVSRGVRPGGPDSGGQRLEFAG